MDYLRDFGQHINLRRWRLNYMRKQFLILLIISLITTTCKSKEIKILDFDFFGFKLNYNYQKVIEVIKSVYPC